MKDLVTEMSGAVPPWNSIDSVADAFALRIRITGIEEESAERQREIDVCLNCPYEDCINCLAINKKAVIKRLEDELIPLNMALKGSKPERAT